MRFLLFDGIEALERGRRIKVLSEVGRRPLLDVAPVNPLDSVLRLADRVALTVQVGEPRHAAVRLCMEEDGWFEEVARLCEAATAIVHVPLFGTDLTAGGGAFECLENLSPETIELTGRMHRVGLDRELDLVAQPGLREKTMFVLPGGLAPFEASLVAEALASRHFAFMSSELVVPYDRIALLMDRRPIGRCLKVVLRFGHLGALDNEFTVSTSDRPENLEENPRHQPRRENPIELLLRLTA